MSIASGPNLGIMSDGLSGESHYTQLMAALRGIDGLVQCHVLDKDLATPPASPVNGAMYIVAGSPTGAWVGLAGRLVRYYTAQSTGPGWESYIPKKGWTVHVEDESLDYQYNGTAWAVVVAVAGRELLTANRNYFVRADGSDSNNGLANTAAGAFLTLQKASDVIAALDTSIYNVNVTVGAGTFESAIFSDPLGAGVVNLTGQGATSIINRTATTGAAISFGGESKKWRFTSVKYQALNGTDVHGVLVSNNQQTQLTNCISGVCTGFHINVSEGYLRITGTHTIDGNAKIHWLCSYKGQIVAGANITLIGSIAFAQAFAFCNIQALIRMGAITFTGSATGVRYNVSTQSQINVNGAGLTYLPGSVAGVTDTATGGLYL